MSEVEKSNALEGTIVGGAIPSGGETVEVDAQTMNQDLRWDSPFRVVDSTHIEYLDSVLEPTVVCYVDRDGSGVGPEEIQARDTWEPVTGYSGQQGYRGPCMHSSEQFSGGMSRDVMEDVGGVYVIVVVECEPFWDATEEESDDVRQGDPAGWMLLKLRELHPGY